MSARARCPCPPAAQQPRAFEPRAFAPESPVLLLNAVSCSRPMYRVVRPRMLSCMPHKSTPRSHCAITRGLLKHPFKLGTLNFLTPDLSRFTTAASTS
uniref:Uncharacterized protein n=1 Tax=Mycena chlorophos TaxID=658473 RepID=A0ABQ0L319_MYCCL|nr:predicted protein [Mycena chlorophos]